MTEFEFEHPSAPISEKNFETWLTTDPLALAIVAGDAEAVLQLSEHLPDYVKKRIAQQVTTGPVDTTDAALRNAARRLAIKQKKARANG